MRFVLALIALLVPSFAWAETLTVREDATGAYTTLAAAITAADPGDIIEIQQWDSGYETGTLTIADANLTITATGAARVGDNVAGTGNHYKIQATSSSSDTDHVFTASADGWVIDGIEILQNSTGSSDEGIRVNNDGTVKNSKIWSDDDVSAKDGIYAPNVDVDVTVENTSITGFSRLGINAQNYSGTVTQNWYINSVIVTGCGADGGANDSGGIGIRRTDVTTLIKVYLANSTVASQHANATADLLSYNVSDGPRLEWNVEQTLYGAGHQTGALNTDTNNTTGAAITDNTSPGAGVWIIVEDFTGARPWNLKLIDDADNDALEAHSVTSFLSGAITLPSTDIDGVTRTADYCVGPFEVGEAAPPAGVNPGIILNL